MCQLHLFAWSHLEVVAHHTLLISALIGWRWTHAIASAPGWPSLLLVCFAWHQVVLLVVLLNLTQVHIGLLAIKETLLEDLHFELVLLLH